MLSIQRRGMAVRASPRFLVHGGVVHTYGGVLLASIAKAMARKTKGKDTWDGQHNCNRVEEGMLTFMMETLKSS